MKYGNKPSEMWSEFRKECLIQVARASKDVPYQNAIFNFLDKATDSLNPFAGLEIFLTQQMKYSSMVFVTMGKDLFGNFVYSNDNKTFSLDVNLRIDIVRSNWCGFMVKYPMTIKFFEDGSYKYYAGNRNTKICVITDNPICQADVLSAPWDEAVIEGVIHTSKEIGFRNVVQDMFNACTFSVKSATLDAVKAVFGIDKVAVPGYGSLINPLNECIEAIEGRAKTVLKNCYTDSSALSAISALCSSIFENNRNNDCFSPFVEAGLDMSKCVLTIEGKTYGDLEFVFSFNQNTKVRVPINLQPKIKVVKRGAYTHYATDIEALNVLIGGYTIPVKFSMKGYEKMLELIDGFPTLTFTGWERIVMGELKLRGLDYNDNYSYILPVDYFKVIADCFRQTLKNRDVASVLADEYVKKGGIQKILGVTTFTLHPLYKAMTDKANIKNVFKGLKDKIIDNNIKQVADNGKARGTKARKGVLGKKKIGLF